MTSYLKHKAVKARSINLILGELNENSTMEDIRKAQYEIKENMYSYPLVQLEFCKEYLDDMMEKATRKLNRKRGMR